MHMNKLLDLLFLFLSHTLIRWYGWRSSSRKAAPNQVRSILALPYYPENWPGGGERIGNWKTYFEKEGIQFDVVWASEQAEMLEKFNGQQGWKRYRFFFSILFRRVKVLKQLKTYDSIWIQRAFIPYYPYNDAYFEKLVNRLHPHVVMDFYDADYVHNYDLVVNAVKAAFKVSASTPFLANFFSQFNSSVTHLNMTIDPSAYLPHHETEGEDLIVGWMGSPGNLGHIHHIKEGLMKIEREFPQVTFHFVCQIRDDFGLKNVKFIHWDEEGFDYYQWMSKVDIGIIPYFGEDDVPKAKSPMKTLELMACNIPLVGTPNAAYPEMKHGVHYLAAETADEWYLQLKQLIEDQSMRKAMGQKGLEYFKSGHTYEVNYPIVKRLLT